MEAPQRIRKQSPTLTLQQQNNNKKAKVKAEKRLEVVRLIGDSFMIHQCKECQECHDDGCDCNGEVTGTGVDEMDEIQICEPTVGGQN